MSLKDLTTSDFEYYKHYARDMQNCHEKEFLKRIDPDLMRAFYRGLNTKSLYKGEETDIRGFYNDESEYLTLTRIFQACNTILPNLYYQNPKPIVIGERGTDADSAALMSSLLKHYMKANNSKRQNQEAVMNAWFFGIGWKKMGYRTVFMPREKVAQEPETILGNIQQGVKNMLGIKPDSNESKETPDIVDYETLFNNSESPMNIMLDHKHDFMNKKAILHKLPRTLYDLQTFGEYDEKVLSDIYEKMKYDRGTRLSSREIELSLNELHVQQRNGVWILTWIDEFEKPLRYEKSTNQDKGFDFEGLILTNEPGVRYPISHMRVATQIQAKLDDQATLFYEIISRIRNQILINEKELSPGQKKAVEMNKSGGIIWTNKPISPSTYAQLTSASVSNDLPLLMQITQQNITEIMGTDEQIISGQSKNKTLGQDELARVGTKIRESGMLDKVRDWVINQLRREGGLLKQFSNAELHLQITGKDYSDPATGMTQESRWVSFMTPENPLGAKNFIQGEFDYDINIYEAIKPDKQAIQAECIQAIQLFSNPQVQEAMLANGTIPRIDKLAEKAADSFEFLKGEEFVERLDSRQIAAIQAQKVLMQNAGQVPQSLSSQGNGTKPEAQKETTVNSSEAAQL